MRISNVRFEQGRSVYDTYTRDRLLDCYRSGNWNQMSDEEKMKLLQATGNRYAEEHGLHKKPLFRQEYGRERYGGYGRDGMVAMNLELCQNPYQALDTVAHEMNHVYQAQCVHNHNGSYPSAERVVLKAQSGSAYAPRGKGYARQTIEIDSNNAGASYVLAERERFADDPAYTEYLMNRVIHFENSLADYRENTGVCDMFELVQVDHAARAGELGGGERMVAESYLRGEEKPVKELREKLAGEVKQCWLDCAAAQERRTEEKLTAEERWNRRMQIVRQCHREWDRIKSSFLNGTGTVHASDVRMLQMKNYLQIRQLTELEEELKAQRVADVEQAAAYMEDQNLDIQNLADVSYVRQMSAQIEQMNGQIAACKKEITLLRADCERLRIRTGILVEEPVSPKAEEADRPGSGESRGPGMMGRMMERHRKDRESFRQTEASRGDWPGNGIVENGGTEPDDAPDPETVGPGGAGEDDGLDVENAESVFSGQDICIRVGRDEEAGEDDGLDSGNAESVFSGQDICIRVGRGEEAGEDDGLDFETAGNEEAGEDDGLDFETAGNEEAGEDDGLDQENCQVNLAARDDGLDYENC